MSTRDDTRRELRDLAKLASAVPADRPSESQQVRAHQSNGLTGSHITVPPAVASLPAHRQPPAISANPSIIPNTASRPVAVIRTAFGGASGLRGIWAVLAGGTLAAAIVGGVLLGQTLTSRFSPESNAEPSSNANTPAPEAEWPAASSVAVTAAAATQEVPMHPSPTTLPVEASSIASLPAAHAPYHTDFKQPPPRPVVVMASPPPRGAIPKAPAKPAAAHSNPQDALEELIRKAASGS